MNLNRLVFSYAVVFVFLGYAFNAKAYPVSNASAFFLNNAQTLEKKGNFPFYDIPGKYNIGDYLPKDQGGKFVQVEILQTEVDSVIVSMIKNRILENIYDNPIDWIKYEKSELEKSVWLSRLYFLPSFGKMYFVTKDTAYSNYAMNFLRRWYRENLELSVQKKTKYNWTDMQIAWRCIHLSWLYFLTEESLSDYDKAFIVDILNNHSKVLLSHFGHQPLNEFNHQSHGALAMLYVGALFPQLEQSDSLKNTAVKILEHHISHAFYKDGGNVEQMFGYYPFEAHIFRDAYLLCRNNNIKQPQGIEELLLKMQRFILSVQQPDHTMPPVNDSYEMPATTILETLELITNTSLQDDSIKSSCFGETQLGVIKQKSKNNSWYILANPAKTIGAHSHAGRLAFTIWYNNIPVVKESGCCNYDNPLLYKWYRTSTAHNTVLIDNKTDEATSTTVLWAPKRQTQNRITYFIENEHYTYLRMHSPSTEQTNSSVDWYRSVVLVDSSYVVVHDFFKAAGTHTYDFLFHVGDSVVFSDKKNGLSLNKSALTFNIVSTNKKQSLALKDGFTSSKGKNVRTKYVQYTINVNGDFHSFFLFTPDIKGLKVETKYTADGAGLIVKQKNKKAKTLLFLNPGSKTVEILKRSTDKPVEIF
jgi:hypothetical protein